MNRSLCFAIAAILLTGCASKPAAPPLPAPGDAKGTMPAAVQDIKATPADQSKAADVIEKANQRDQIKR